VLSQHAESWTPGCATDPEPGGRSPAGSPSTVAARGTAGDSSDTSTTTPVGSPPDSRIRELGGQWIHRSSRSSRVDTSAYQLSADSNRHRVRRAHAIASAGL